MPSQQSREVALPAGIEPEFVSVQQARVVTGLGRSKIYEMIADGRIETVKVDGRRLVRLRSAKSVGKAA
jgi:excisionase family DNA binding protein